MGDMEASSTRYRPSRRRPIPQGAGGPAALQGSEVEMGLPRRQYGFPQYPRVVRGHGGLRGGVRVRRLSDRDGAYEDRERLRNHLC